MESLIELAESLMVDLLIMDVDFTAQQQRELDGQGCDEGCGLCNDGHQEAICWWHGVARHASCLIPRKVL